MKKLLTIMSVALLVGCFSIRQPTLVGHAPMPTRGICAHRGASDTHPENTIAAFREAIRLGAQMIEFDVALSKDGELVLMHDRTIDRTTNGSGRPEDWLLADLKKLDAGSWKNSRFEGERIPTLGEALDVMPGNIWLNVHLKGGVELDKKNSAPDRIKEPVAPGVSGLRRRLSKRRQGGRVSNYYLQHGATGKHASIRRPNDRVRIRVHPVAGRREGRSCTHRTTAATRDQDQLLLHKRSGDIGAIVRGWS